MEVSGVAENNQTTMPMFSYYSTTLLGDASNQDVITGLLIGLVIGIAILVLLVGILLALLLLSRVRSRIIPFPSADAAAHPQDTGNGSEKFEPSMGAYPDKQPQQQPRIIVQPPPPPGMHPALRDPYSQEGSMANDVEQSEVPRTLVPRVWDKKTSQLPAQAYEQVIPTVHQTKSV